MVGFTYSIQDTLSLGKKRNGTKFAGLLIKYRRFLQSVDRIEKFNHNTLCDTEGKDNYRIDGE